MQDKDATKESNSMQKETKGEFENSVSLPTVPTHISVEGSEQQKFTKKSFLDFLRSWGYWKRWRRYRNFLKHERPSSGSRHKRKAEENAKGKLPEDENVQIPGIWVAELYTPSTVEGLFKGIDNLGWKYGKSRDKNLSKWMSDVRAGRQAGWTNLGLVSPINTAQFISERTAPLPLGVSVAFPILMSLTSSLTAFIVVFLFDDDTTNSFEAPLRKDIKSITKAHPLNPWHVVQYILLNKPARFINQIIDPDMIRRREVKSILKELENRCQQWVLKHVPGTFASLKGSRAPTATLFVTDKVKPMTEEARNIRAFDGLAISRSYDAWESDEWPGGRLVLPSRIEDEGNRLIFSCRRRDAFPDEPGYHGPMSNWTIAQRADDLIQGLLSRWAITCLQNSYHVALSTLRDRTAYDGRYRIVKDLKELRSLARTTLYDIYACTQEIVHFTESDIRYCHEVLEMSYNHGVKGKKADLLSNFRISQKKLAQRLHQEATLLQSMLLTSNDISQMISSIRVQRFLVILTIISIAIASLALYLTITNIPK